MAKMNFKNQTCIITGGSRGLGLALASELVRQNAIVALIARDLAELSHAQTRLLKIRRTPVHIYKCDVTHKGELEKVFSDLHKKTGRIDLLINNAGSITVGPFETMNRKDFEAQLELHLYAVIEATRLVLPYLREKASEKRILNICSMGGRVAMPHMLPYDVSKFALSGFSQGVGAELFKEGISVTTIYPALMRTGSPIQAVFKGAHKKEFAWFQAADVMPFLSTPADVAARKILQATYDRRWELTPSLAAKLRMAAAVLAPDLVGKSLGWLNKLLPDGKSRQYKTGAQANELFENSWLTQPLVNAAHESEKTWNQKPKTDPNFNMGLH